jgi:hypothetical protein
MISFDVIFSSKVTFVALSKKDVLMKREKEKITGNQLEPEYLTRKESANFLRISLANFDKRKDIERIFYGKSVRFSIQTLREYAAKHTIGEMK